MKPTILHAEEVEPPSGTTLNVYKVFDYDFKTIGEKNVKSTKNYPTFPSNLNFTLPTHSRFVVSSQTKDFIMRHYPLLRTEEWNDWRWQLKNVIRTVDELKRFINLTEDEENFFKLDNNTRPFAVTPYYLSLFDSSNLKQELRKCIIPQTFEFVSSKGESEDPLHEDCDSPVPGLVHRYPDRVLFLVTSFCSTNCRYCTRSRMVISPESKPFSQSQWEAAIDYIKKNRNIRDVLLSGGDPLTLSDSKLEWLLVNLRSIPHVEIIRIGTKVPVVLPQRITSNLCRILRKYHPLFMSIHFTHPDELTPEVKEACTRLADSGIPLGSQTVLLKGINDNVETMKNLMQGMLKMRVRPYYLYQCDPVNGTVHFRTPVEKGLEIIKGLRGHTSGYAVPSYVIDAPGGGGKIPLLPNYVEGYEGNDLVLKNYEELSFRYPDYA